MGPSRYNHLILFLFQPIARIGLRAGCDDLKRPSEGTLRAKNLIATYLDPIVQSSLPCYISRAYSAQESFRVISTARLRTSPPVHLPPIDVVVFNDPKGDLILRLASCLDAFSTYPYPTRLPGRAPGGTTGWPEVGPTRSSRTSVRSPQISNAHNR